MCHPETGACTEIDKPDGTACDDGDRCTLSDACQQGLCVGASRVACTARDACHDVGQCDPMTGGCSEPAKAEGAACDDEDVCSEGEVCRGGVCGFGHPVMCAAGECQVGACVADAGCMSTAAADGSGCSGGGRCQAGTCLGGQSDAGALGGVEALSGGDGGTVLGPAVQGCGCSGSGAFPWVWVAAVMLRRRRR
jgi:uncharacterized protein (TIGR03382 family)